MEAKLDRTLELKVPNGSPVSCCAPSSKSPTAVTPETLVAYTRCPEAPRLQHPPQRSVLPKGLPSPIPLR